MSNESIVYWAPPNEIAALNNTSKNMVTNKLVKARLILDKILDNMITEQKQTFDKLVTMNDISDLINGFKKRGFNDESKLQGALNKANSIAAKQGKAGDKKIVVGIMQSFFSKKQLGEKFKMKNYENVWLSVYEKKLINC